MKLIIFRHAEKDLSNWSSDPELSQLGFLQAENLKELVAQKKLPIPNLLWTSPKTRARQTFKALSDWSKIPIEIWTDLEERQKTESMKQFQERINKFIFSLDTFCQKQETDNQVLFLCSHSDWLDEFSVLLPSDLNPDLTPEVNRWMTTQYAQFEATKSNIWSFIKVGRVPAESSRI